MPLFEISSIVVLAALAWLWLDGIRARDIAVAAARDACVAAGVQFLDETVAIASLKPVRDEEGRLTLRRAYAFEFSTTGENRRPGSIVLLGRTVLVVNVGPRLVAP